MHMKIDMSLGKCNQVFRRCIFMIRYIFGTNLYHFIVSYIAKFKIVYIFDTDIYSHMYDQIISLYYKLSRE